MFSFKYINRFLNNRAQHRKVRERFVLFEQLINSINEMLIDGKLTHIKCAQFSHGYEQVNFYRCMNTPYFIRVLKSDNSTLFELLHKDADGEAIVYAISRKNKSIFAESLTALSFLNVENAFHTFSQSMSLSPTS